MRRCWADHTAQMPQNATGKTDHLFLGRRPAHSLTLAASETALQTWGCERSTALFQRRSPLQHRNPDLIVELFDLAENLPEDQRLLGLDLGTKSIGLALSDVSLPIASP